MSFARIISMKLHLMSLALVIVSLITEAASVKASDSFETRIEMSDNGTFSRNFRLFYDFSPASLPTSEYKPRSAIMYHDHDLLHHLIYAIDDPRILHKFFDNSKINASLLGPENMKRMLEFLHQVPNNQVR